MKKQFLQITTICDKNSCVVPDISDTCNNLELVVRNMRHVLDADKSISIFNLSGSWHAINKMESYLKKLTSDNSDNLISFSQNDFSDEENNEYNINYHLNIVAPTDDNILSELQNFLIVNEIKLEYFSFDNYIDRPKQIPLIVINAKISILKDISLSDLRERFILFCDSLNVDGVLDPIRPI